MRITRQIRCELRRLRRRRNGGDSFLNFREIHVRVRLFEGEICELSVGTFRFALTAPGNPASH